MIFACLIVSMPILMLLMQDRTLTLIAHALISICIIVFLIFTFASVDINKTETIQATAQGMDSKNSDLAKKTAKAYSPPLLNRDDGLSGDQMLEVQTKSSIATLEAGTDPGKERNDDDHASRLIPLDHGPSANGRSNQSQSVQKSDSSNGFTITDSF